MELRPYEFSQLDEELRVVAPGFQNGDQILNYITIVPLIFNIISAFFCLGCSAAFHLLYVKSETVSKILSRLDYGGISILILGSACPIIYYSFACQPAYLMRWIWLGFMSTATLGCFVASLVPKFDSPKYRPVRGGMFLITGLSTILIFISILSFKNDFKIPVDVTVFAIGGYLYV